MTRATEIELRRIEMPLVGAFRTSFGTETVREALLVKVVTEDAVGWGECVAASAPRYSSEYIASAEEVIARFLVPPLLGGDDIAANELQERFAGIKGHRMAKASVEMAWLDAELRPAGVSLAKHLGGVAESVPVGVSVGIFDTIPELLDAVDGYLDDGYQRIKLKIEPGWDLAMVEKVRSHVGADVGLQVDANAAYTRDDGSLLNHLDEFSLILVEQPLAADDLMGHASLALSMTTPICLDESITSARITEDALFMDAASIINIKAGRVGGYLEAKRIHDLCARLGVPVWCGGMLETGLGRAANLALASLPNFTLPGDISASSRYYHRDLTEPFVVEDGHMRVPTGPGLGVEPDPEFLEEVTTKVTRVTN